jgi:hypothetical protein
MRRTARVDPRRLEAIARRRFQDPWRNAQAPQSIPIPCLPTSTSWRSQADRRGALEPRFLPWRCFRALADDASSPRWIRERLRRVGRPRPGAILFPAWLFVRRRSWRAPQKPAKPKSEPERSSCYVRGTNQPTCAYRFSFWINPIGALTPRQLHHSIIQTAIDKKTIPAVPHGRKKWNKWHQMIRSFFPSPVEGWGCRRLQKTTAGDRVSVASRQRRQPGNARVPGTKAFRKQGRSGNEGVGEHVRTRFHGGPWGPVKLRTMRSAPNEENLFLLPEGLSRSELLETTIQPFDLMSRRHPLSSTRAFRLKSASRSRSS